MHTDSPESQKLLQYIALKQCFCTSFLIFFLIIDIYRKYLQNNPNQVCLMLMTIPAALWYKAGALLCINNAEEVAKEAKEKLN